jgi:predicted DNA-binding transcriptional regulator AlpA
MKQPPGAPTAKPPLADDQHRFMTRKEVAALLRVHPMTTYRIALPAPYRFGGKSVRWARAEIEAWIAKRQSKSG